MADPIFVSIFSGAVSMYEKLKLKEGLAKILSDNGRDEYIAPILSQLSYYRSCTLRQKPMWTMI